MCTLPIQLNETKPLVLLIDDCVVLHRLLSLRLSAESLEVMAADSGEKGLTLAREFHPALILLDLEMPGMDGFEVLRAIKEDSDLRDVPVIVVSGLDGAEDKVMAFDLGAYDFVTKPFNLAELRARVRAALRMYSLLQMLSQRAQLDGLSGLWNRAYFDSQWEAEVARSARHGYPLSLGLIDIDHFKSINDTYGHPAGDAVIQVLAKLLVAEIRQSDVACRYGGEEFALVMPSTPPDEAGKMCERIRSHFETLRWPRHPERSVTISIGVAGVAKGTAVTAKTWLEAADQKLYAAKQAGRNRVVVADIGGPALPRLATAG